MKDSLDMAGMQGPRVTWLEHRAVGWPPAGAHCHPPLRPPPHPSSPSSPNPSLCTPLGPTISSSEPHLPPPCCPGPPQPTPGAPAHALGCPGVSGLLLTPGAPSPSASSSRASLRRRPRVASVRAQWGTQASGSSPACQHPRPHFSPLGT